MLDPLQWPSVSLRETERLPDSPGVYAAMQGDEVLYVGKSVSLRKRWYSHHRRIALEGHGFIRLAYKVLLRDQIDTAEIELIKKYHPALNNVPGNIVYRRVHVSEPLPHLPTPIWAGLLVLIFQGTFALLLAMFHPGPVPEWIKTSFAVGALALVAYVSIWGVWLWLYTRHK